MAHEHARRRPLASSPRFCLCLVDVSSGRKEEKNALARTEPGCFLSQRAVDFGLGDLLLA